VPHAIPLPLGQHARHGSRVERPAGDADVALLGEPLGDLAQAQPRPLGLEGSSRGDGTWRSCRRAAAVTTA
jgi:hypothetical protein